MYSEVIHRLAYSQRKWWYYQRMTIPPNIGAINPLPRIQQDMKSVGQKISNIRLGSSSGYYKSNTLGETANLIKSAIPSAMKFGKK
jgi:hypothetical protein